MHVTDFRYPNKPIYKIESLAKHLDVSPLALQKIAESSHDYYRPVEQFKKNGDVRICYSVREPLKSVLKKSRTRITAKVNYPYYLQGSIKGRSPKTNAEIHVGSMCLIQLDVANFFPSITRQHVYEIFRYFFHFSEDVSNLLATLMTYKDQIPQGSPVSSDIANLVLSWDGKEEQLVNGLAIENLRYSRYVDDIATSSPYPLTNSEKTEIIRTVNYLVKSKGFKIRHKKTLTSGPKETKCLTGVKIGKFSNDVPSAYIDSVYHEIKQLKSENTVSNEQKLSLTGKINHIKQFNEKQALRLNDCLESVITPN